MGLIDVISSPKIESQMKVWYSQILDVLKHAIVQARAERKPARIGYGTGKSYVNINRDEIIDGKGTIGNNFERPSDKTLALVRLEDYSGTPIAFIVNYAVHAVVLNGNSVKIGVSGDLPGRTSAALEEKFEGAVALWTSGAAGDQNPRIMSSYGAEIVDGKVKVNSLGTSAYLILNFLTNEHVRDILKVNDSLKCDVESARIFASEFIATCPARVRKSGTGKLSAPQSTDEKAPDEEFILRLLTVGDIAFEGISAEVVTTIGTALKEASPYRKTMVVTHVTHQGCYVTDEWGYENETFEAEGTLVQKGYAQPAFLTGFEEMFREMFNQ